VAHNVGRVATFGVVVGAIAGIFAIVTAVGRFTVWGRARLDRLRRRSHRPGLYFVPFPQTFWWDKASESGRPAAQVFGTWRVTGVGEMRSVVRAYVKHDGRECEGSVSAAVGIHFRPAKQCPLGDGSKYRSLDLHLHMFVTPRAQESGELRLKLAFVDSFGKKHLQKGVFQFRPTIGAVRPVRLPT
jgi:hypothetical protein